MQMVVPEPRRQIQRFRNQVCLAAIVVAAATLARSHDETVGHRTDPGAIGKWRIQAHFAAVQVPDEKAVAVAQ